MIRRSSVPSSLILAALLICAGPAHAADQNVVGALLVYPAVLTLDPVGGVNETETWLRVTNYDLDGTGGIAVDVHLYFIDGDTCLVCDTTFPLAVKQTAQVVVKSDGAGGSTLLLPGGGSLSCPGSRGYAVMTLEASGSGTTIGDNLIAGEQIYVDPTDGRSFATRAFAIQGQAGNNGDGAYDFDDLEYSKLPRILAFDFVAPFPVDGFNTYAALLTPGFAPGTSPATDCSITGYDDQANPFSSSYAFPCWSLVELSSISPEFAYPNLGLAPAALDEYGWLQANCQVDPDDGGAALAGDGGVLGLIFSLAPEFTAPFGRSLPSPLEFESAASWGRLGLQSVTTGDPFTLDNP